MLLLVMVNIAKKQGREEVLRDWLMDRKFVAHSGFASDSTRRRRQHNELQAVDKQSVPAKVTGSGREKGFFFFGRGTFEKHEMRAAA